MSSVSSTSTFPSISNSSAFFEKLPAEIRDYIYELVFTPDHDENTEIELSTASPPEKSLLLTCRQAYNEANKHYYRAHGTYWSMTMFVHNTKIPVPGTTPSENPLDVLGDAEVERIRHIKVRYCVDDLNIEHCLIDPRGGWMISINQQMDMYWWTTSRPSGYTTRVVATREALEENLSRGPVEVSRREQIEYAMFSYP